MAVNPDHPIYRQFLANHLTNLIRAAEGLGRTDEADLARRQLTELTANKPGSAALDARLANVIKGGAPKDDPERLALAYRAYEKGLHAASAGLFAEALANDPKLGDDRQAQHAYNAACAAALAGCGQGKDDAPLDDAAKSKLRHQSHDWLQSELAAWAKVLDSGTAEMKAVVHKNLEHWKSDTDLAGIRDEKELAKLHDPECADFLKFWKDVDQLVDRAAGRK